MDGARRGKATVREAKNKRAADREVNATRFRGLVRRSVMRTPLS